MKLGLLLLMAIGLNSFCFSQTDTIFSNNEKIPCTVKEVTPDAVKYTYQGEDVLYSIYKNSIQKIVFKSGRIQTFSEASSFKKVQSADDFENVTITQVESEVKGLFKVGEVSSKAKGTTVYSNQERVKERAYRKIKIQAAFMGANVIYLTNQRQEGNKYGSYYTAGSTTETSLSGVAYTNILPSFDDFIDLIGDKRTFDGVYESHLFSSSFDMQQYDINSKLTIYNIKNEQGLIMIECNFRNFADHTEFRVTSFTKKSFMIFYDDYERSTVYSFVILL